MIFFLMMACSEDKSSFGEDSDTEQAVFYQEEFSSYETWEQATEWEGVHSSQSAHGSSVQIWLNDLAITALEEETPYPDGAAIIKEGYVDEAGTQLNALTLMVKQEGYASDSGDWFWASYSSSGEVQQAGTPEFCVSCHSASSSDYVLFVEESSNTED